MVVWSGRGARRRRCRTSRGRQEVLTRHEVGNSGKPRNKPAVVGFSYRACCGGQAWGSLLRPGSPGSDGGRAGVGSDQWKIPGHHWVAEAVMDGGAF
jgi:hypothetical protein